MTLRLSDATTMRVGGPARRWLDLGTPQEVADAVAAADAEGTPVLVLGEGSNLVVGDDGFDGLVIRSTDDSVVVTDDSSCGGVSVTVGAGTPWDAFVARTVAEGWVGLEALSGIPGLAGATPVQNVGAYGAEVADVIATVRTWDRELNKIRTFMSVECLFRYRSSIFKQSMTGQAQPRWFPSPRWVVLSVTMQLPHATLSAPVRYDQLATALGVDLGQRVPIVEVREAVLALRRSKAMVLDETDHDTWSAGSFFTNPILTQEQAGHLPAAAPRYPTGSADRVKTSAAWLIEHAGCPRGFGLNDRATLSTTHALALTNRGGASAADIAELARHVRTQVAQATGVLLEPEPVLVGLDLTS